MSADDCIWYGRVGAWAGSGLLFLMAATGRSLAPLIVLSVLAIIAGLVLLIFGLWSREQLDASAASAITKEEAESHA